MKNKRPLIEHKVIEIFGIKSETIWSCKEILPKIKKFSEKIGLKILAEKYYDFKPQGATLIFVLSSSHLAVHTWPENGYLHIDLVTCAKISSDDKITKTIQELFNVSSDQINIREINYEQN